MRAVAEQHSNRLVADLRAAVTARDEFLSVASHELRTPLSTLRLQSTLLSRWLAQVSLGEHEAELRMHCGDIERQVRRLEMLTGELLDVTRIATGRLELHRELVDLVPLAREAVARHVAEGSHDAMIVLECDASLPGRWDAFRLDQVISNLLANAIRYGQSKPILVAVRGADGAAPSLSRIRASGSRTSTKSGFLGSSNGRCHRITTEAWAWACGLRNRWWKPMAGPFTSRAALVTAQHSS